MKEFRRFGGEKEAFLDESGVKKMDRDKLFDIVVDKMNEEYTVIHKHDPTNEEYMIGPRSGVKVTFKSMDDLSMDSLEN